MMSSHLPPWYPGGVPRDGQAPSWEWRPTGSLIEIKSGRIHGEYADQELEGW